MTAEHRKPDHADEVSGVTSRRQRTEPLECLVDRALVGVALDELRAGLHPDVRHLGEEHLLVRLIKCALFLVPAAAFDVQTEDVSAIRSLGHLIELRFKQNFIVPLDLIDSDGVLSGIVLLQASQETLGEEEA